jgi:hypothetical protein
VHATVPVQLPPPHARAAQPASGKASKKPLIAGIGVVAVLAIAAVLFFALKGSGNSGTPTIAPAPATSAATPAAEPASQPAASSSDASAAGSVVGAWVNLSLKIQQNMPRRLEISGTGDQLSFHMWGACSTCDWGSQPATLQNGDWVAQWTFPQPLANDPPGRITNVTATPAGNELHLVVKSQLPGNRHVEGKWVFVRTSSTQ